MFFETQEKKKEAEYFFFPSDLTNFVSTFIDKAYFWDFFFQAIGNKNLSSHSQFIKI